MLPEIKYQAKLVYALLISAWALSSCTSINITKYYTQHQNTFDNIQQSYKAASKQRAFSIQFTDYNFKSLSLEIWTDTLKYIYEFGATDPRINDTLNKYKLPAATIMELIKKMQDVHCTWINNLDYYVNGQKNYLVFMSIWPKAFTTPFTNKKYYILTYFTQPQYYDSSGVLMDNRRLKKIRKINNDIFKRINDKVAYTVSDRFR